MKILLLTLVGLLCGGCFVLDQIDQGLDVMETHTPDSEKAKAAVVGSDEKADGSPKSARERLNEYYAKQRSQAPGSVTTADPGDKVGRCRIRGTTQFTRRSDCLLRGGSFQ